MLRDETRFSTHLPGSVVKDLRAEKNQTGLSLKVITTAFLRHCLDMAARERHAVVMQYLEGGRAKGRGGARTLKMADAEVREQAGIPMLDETALDFDQGADLRELAARQGVTAAADFDGLLGDFWPEDETVDEFVATVRTWRRESSRSAGTP